MWTLLANNPFYWASGWVLLNTIWLAVVVWVLHRISQKLLAKSRAESRYISACACLAVLIVSSILMGYIVWSFKPEDMDWAPQRISHGNRFQMPVISDYSTVSSWMLWLEPVLPVASIAWALGVLTKCVLTLAGWLHLKRIVSKSVAISDVDFPYWKPLCQKLLGQRTVLLVLCDFISSPSTVGWLKPIVLVPAIAITNLSSDQLECIFAHELAHIRRRDYLVNLIQTLVETLLFFHPCVRWLSNDIRQLREDCCDDIAIHVLGSPKGYAESLLALEKARPGFELALGATGGSLVDRIGRLAALKQNPSQLAPVRLISTLIIVSLLLGLTSTSWGRITQSIREQAILSKKSFSEILYEKIGPSQKNNPKLIEVMKRTVAFTNGKIPKDPQVFSELVDELLKGGNPRDFLNESIPYLVLQNGKLTISVEDCPVGSKSLWLKYSGTMWKYALSLNQKECSKWARASALLAEKQGIDIYFSPINNRLTNGKSPEIFGLSEAEVNQIARLFEYRHKSESNKLQSGDNSNSQLSIKDDIKYDELLETPNFQILFAQKMLDRGQDGVRALSDIIKAYPDDPMSRRILFLLTQAH